MSFGKLVTLAMLTAFSAGAGYSYMSDRYGLPMPGVALSQETASRVESEKSQPIGAVHQELSDEDAGKRFPILLALLWCSADALRGGWRHALA